MRGVKLEILTFGHGTDIQKDDSLQPILFSSTSEELENGVQFT
jgi:hypothetical protein